MTKIINIKSGAKYDIYIGRANLYYNLPESKWANKYVIGKDGTREECIEKYKNDLLNNPKLLEDLHEIDGQILGCYCAPDFACHGNVLIELREKQKSELLKFDRKLPTPLNNQKKRVAIVGSRNYNNRAEIYKYLDSKLNKIGHLVSGGCPSGADNIAEQYAKDRGLSITIHYPNWEKDGRGAGFIRNRRIVEDCEILIAWQANKSAGTQNSIDLARKLNKQVIIFEVESDNLEKQIQEHKEKTKDSNFGQY